MYDVVIIGAGPAGLMAGYILDKSGISYKIIEKGKNYSGRNGQNPYDVSYGFGGAGLFSDGKFSYPPAASKLWTKCDRNILEEAYNNFYELLNNIGIEIKQWKSGWIDECLGINKCENEKHYEYTSVNKGKRELILKYFHKIIVEPNKIVFNSTVNCIKRYNSGFQVECSDGNLYQCHSVIVATGKRSCSDILDNLKNIRYRKYCEVGVRVECANEYFLRGNKNEDLKYIHSVDDNTEIRTFCTCWNGKVVKSMYDDFKVTFNGEAVESSKKSNLGIVIKNNNAKSKLYQNCADVYNQTSSEQMDLISYRKGKHFLGSRLDNEIRKYLDILLKDTAEGTVYGPEIEKYGKYPVPDMNLQVVPGVYIAGDISAMFRGLVAAFVSGAYVALKIKKDEDFKRVINELAVKTSSTEAMKLVFTAHSKNNFYARNVICEHVFRNNMIPINPYRSFGYFLDDRIDRDIVRQANNQMVNKCDELWVYGPISDGVLFEIVNAIRFNKPIKFFTVGTRLGDIKEIKVDSLKFEPEVHAKRIRKVDIQEFIKRGLASIKK